MQCDHGKMKPRKDSAIAAAAQQREKSRNARDCKKDPAAGGTAPELKNQPTGREGRPSVGEMKLGFEHSRRGTAAI